MAIQGIIWLLARLLCTESFNLFTRNSNINTMNTIENNRLIAEFMGVKLKMGGQNVWDSNPNLGDFFRVTTYEKDGLCKQCHNGPSHGHSTHCYIIDDKRLKYHSNWDWLMPVVAKIEQLPDIYDIEEFLLIRDELCTARIETVYTTVVDFIKWHNQQNS